MNIDHKTGGPAFPFKVLLNNGDGTKTEHIFSGMTLRDYFAAKAMQGLIANPEWNSSAFNTAKQAYAFADAMLEARGK